MSDQTPDHHTDHAEVPEPSAAERIAGMKRADQDAATAAPMFVVVPTDDVAAASLAKKIGERLGNETAKRRYLIELVEQLLASAERTVDELHRDHDQTDVEDLARCQETAAAAAGAERVAGELHRIMHQKGHPHA